MAFSKCSSKEHKTTTFLVSSMTHPTLQLVAEIGRRRRQEGLGVTRGRLSGTSRSSIRRRAIVNLPIILTFWPTNPSPLRQAILIDSYSCYGSITCRYDADSYHTYPNGAGVILVATIGGPHRPLRRGDKDSSPSWSGSYVRSSVSTRSVT